MILRINGAAMPFGATMSLRTFKHVFLGYKLMIVEMWPAEKPIPYARNARKLTAAAVDKVAASIQEFGFRQPIVVDEQDVIIVGHTRLIGAKRLGMAEVPVHVARGLTPAQVKAYRLADNRTNQETAWDLELLGPEFEELRALDFDLTLTAFDMSEIEALEPIQEGLTDPDECPDVPAAPVSQLGDLWLLGEHRVLCGDSTSIEAVSRLLDRATGALEPFLMVTDPPYGVEYDPKWRLDAGVNKPWQKRAEGKVLNDDRADWHEAWKLFPGAVAYVWHGGAHAAAVAISLHAEGFEIRAQIIWAKASLVMGRGHYHWQHEPCWYAVRKGKTSHWHGDRKQATLWQIANMHRTQGSVDDGKTIHGTQKPVECMRRPILNHTTKGEAVYDPFLGSGTTIIASELTGRICYGLELDPTYVDVIVQRWQNHTGKHAVLGDGPYKGSTFEKAKFGRRLAAEDAIKEEVLEMSEKRNGATAV